MSSNASLHSKQCFLWNMKAPRHYSYYLSFFTALIATGCTYRQPLYTHFTLRPSPLGSIFTAVMPEVSCSFFFFPSRCDGRYVLNPSISSVISFEFKASPSRKKRRRAEVEMWLCDWKFGHEDKITIVRPTVVKHIMMERDKAKTWLFVLEDFKRQRREYETRWEAIKPNGVIQRFLACGFLIQMFSWQHMYRPRWNTRFSLWLQLNNCLNDDHGDFDANRIRSSCLKVWSC